MHQNATPDIEIRMTAYDHLNAHKEALRAARRLLAAAQTGRDKAIYEIWILNASRNIAHWQAQIEREHR